MNTKNVNNEILSKKCSFCGKEVEDAFAQPFWINIDKDFGLRVIHNINRLDIYYPLPLIITRDNDVNFCSLNCFVRGILSIGKKWLGLNNKEYLKIYLNQLKELVHELEKIMNENREQIRC